MDAKLSQDEKLFAPGRSGLWPWPRRAGVKERSRVWEDPVSSLFLCGEPYQTGGGGGPPD